MSEPSGTAARLVARAGRRAIGRRHPPGLVEMSLPPSGAQPVPFVEPAPAATPGARLTPPVAETALPAAASGALRAQAARAADAPTSTPLRAADRAVLSVEPHPTELAPGPEPRPLVPPLAPVQMPGPSAPSRERVMPVPAALAADAGAEAVSPPARPGDVSPRTVLPKRIVPTATPPAPAAAAPRPAAAPPPVVIDRIEIVTPPARPPAPDPLASVAARRAGRSRHAGAR